MNNDKPTSLMRSGGGALRSITEYLRAASIPGMGNSGNLETTGPINNSGSLIPGDETLNMQTEQRPLFQHQMVWTFQEKMSNTCQAQHRLYRVRATSPAVFLRMVGWRT